ncbi:MAG: SDR family oxidoreductase [Pseudomonadales bacterium]
MNRFVGKTIMVTGAAGGIGRSLCQLFAEEGAKIAALDRDVGVSDFVHSLTESGYEASAAIADIALQTEVDAGVEALREKLGPIDILVNNARFSSALNLESTSAQSWCADLQCNLTGAYHCTSAVLSDMKRSNAGSIVNIGSVNGTTALGDPAYSAAKAGLISYTKSIAVEFGRYGIRANIICPGTVRTPIWHERVKKKPDLLSALVKWYPLGRVVEPIEIARVAAFLASDDASAISGATVPVDCGLSAGNLIMARELTVDA